jgi:hypothetical protein
MERWSFNAYQNLATDHKLQCLAGFLERCTS